MARDREVMALAKTYTLETIAHRIQRAPASILKRAAGQGSRLSAFAEQSGSTRFRLPADEILERIRGRPRA